MEINGRTAIVTGAASGIGQATAIGLATGGAYVVLADVDEVAARLTRERIEAAGGRATVVRADVTLEHDVSALYEFASALQQPLSVVVNNAGVVEAIDTQKLRFPDMDSARWSRMLDINLRGVVLSTQYAIQAMQGHAGAIVNVASGAGIGLSPHDAPVYAAAKAGVVRFTGALGETAGIRVNCICPGWVDTPMSRRGRAERTPEEWARIAPDTMLDPGEIAESIVSLIRDDSLAGRILLHYEGEAPRLLPIVGDEG